MLCLIFVCVALDCNKKNDGSSEVTPWMVFMEVSGRMKEMKSFIGNAQWFVNLGGQLLVVSPARSR